MRLIDENRLCKPVTHFYSVSCASVTMSELYSRYVIRSHFSYIEFEDVTVKMDEMYSYQGSVEIPGGVPVDYFGWLCGMAYDKNHVCYTSYDSFDNRFYDGIVAPTVKKETFFPVFRGKVCPSHLLLLNLVQNKIFI